MFLSQLLGRSRRTTLGVLSSFVGGTTAGETVTEEKALGFSGVWSATSKLAGALASLPVKLHQELQRGRRVAKEHRLYRLLHDEPNREIDAYLFWEMAIASWINRGNAFAEIERNSLGEIVALWSIPYDSVLGYRRLDDGFLVWEVATSDYGTVGIEDQNMLNLVGSLSSDGLRGKGVLDFARESIGIALANEKLQASYYGNGARVSAVLTHPGKLSPEARANVRKEWQEVHQGVLNSGKTAVLQEGMQYQAISATAEESQTLKASEFRITDLARWYDLPPHVLGDLTRSTFSNIESQQISLVVDSYRPRIERMEKSLRRQLLSDPEKAEGFYFKFVLDAMLRGDPVKRQEASLIEFRHGKLTLNEWRERDDLNPIDQEYGDMHFLPLELSTAELVMSGKNLKGAVAQAGSEPAGQAKTADVPALTTPSGTLDTTSGPADASRFAPCDQVIAAGLDVVEGVWARANTRVANEAIRAAKRPKFLAWLEGFIESYRESLQEELILGCRVLQSTSKNLNSEALADELTTLYLNRYRQQMLSATECQPENLVDSVTQAAEACRSWTWDRTTIENHIHEVRTCKE